MDEDRRVDTGGVAQCCRDRTRRACDPRLAWTRRSYIDRWRRARDAEQPRDAERRDRLPSHTPRWLADGRHRERNVPFDRQGGELVRGGERPAEPDSLAWSVCGGRGGRCGRSDLCGETVSGILQLG